LNVWLLATTKSLLAAILTASYVTAAHAQDSSNIPSIAGLDDTVVAKILNEYRSCLDGNVELARELEEPAEKEFMLEHGDLQCREIRDSQIRAEAGKVKIDLAQDRIDAANTRISRLTAEIIAKARKELGL